MKASEASVNPEFSKEESLRGLLAKIMLWGVALAAVIMVAGMLVYLSAHAGDPTGDRRFSGEPADLTHPVAIFQAAFTGNDLSVMQIGVLILLLNPLVRVALAAVGYGMARDRLYTGIAAIVFAVLVVSYFV